MIMTEADLMLLEDYLDGELSAADARALEERSVRELELANELNRLRADRQIRVKAWRSMEGSEKAVAAVAGRVAASIQRRESFAFLITRPTSRRAAASSDHRAGVECGVFCAVGGEFVTFAHFARGCIEG